jgi:hypothetical protein
VGEGGTSSRGVRGKPGCPLGESGRAELIRLRAESRDDKSAIAELRMQVEFAKSCDLVGRHPRAWKRTTIGGDRPVAAPDLIGRDFTVALDMAIAARRPLAA